MGERTDSAEVAGLLKSLWSDARSDNDEITGTPFAIRTLVGKQPNVHGLVSKIDTDEEHDIALGITRAEDECEWLVSLHLSDFLMLLRTVYSQGAVDIIRVASKGAYYGLDEVFPSGDGTIN